MKCVKVWMILISTGLSACATTKSAPDLRTCRVSKSGDFFVCTGEKPTRTLEELRQEKWIALPIDEYIRGCFGEK